MSEKIRLQRDGQLARVTINRPEKRNALDSETWRDLGNIVGELDNDQSLRCIVFTGTGDKAFAAGNDIDEFETARSNASQVLDYNEIAAGAVRTIETCLHPTVARISGYCLGGGLEIALACDIRIAADNARFGLPVKNMGIFVDPVLANTLINTIGRVTALEMVLEGRIYTAEEALSRGIVTRVVARDQLDSEVGATVHSISAGAPLAARFNRRILRKVGSEATPDATELSAAASYGDSEDYHAAYTAFSTRTTPTFKGR